MDHQRPARGNKETTYASVKMYNQDDTVRSIDHAEYSVGTTNRNKVANSAL